ncbi:MarR family winged helix-turn-helix transcriptional regulator [Cryobacterium suzukii]|nr:MarR family transcriptional regulator [Cryobacterium suzukii]
MAEDSHGAGPGSEFAAPLAELVWTLSDLERRLALGLTIALSEEGSTPDQWRILEILERLDSPTMGELAEASGMANASLSRTVDALEDTACAYRLPTVTDRRRITVHVSDRGRHKLVRIREIVAAWERTLQQRLGADAAQALLEATESAARSLGGAGSNLDLRPRHDRPR